ncbi:hypothetical protein EDEG_02888 [Edhazardia aedis USNM 41457]|uniref:Uncharacterized protein n=1 Tax=Edhazardia aedis (strain USNM 41457) TaxID=1003232 RepID=J9D598_EDHAE|nr:hypothetical protein EDEG_02888 [Edhazardia aedis USNM 41457]|eukprot:EJW02704.1 hypothetical protein EDEG_02888 [Edhazardia aedis USNM 41457]
MYTTCAAICLKGMQNGRISDFSSFCCESNKNLSNNSENVNTESNFNLTNSNSSLIDSTDYRNANGYLGKIKNFGDGSVYSESFVENTCEEENSTSNIYENAKKEKEKKLTGDIIEEKSIDFLEESEISDEIIFSRSDFRKSNKNSKKKKIEKMQESKKYKNDVIENKAESKMSIEHYEIENKIEANHKNKQKENLDSETMKNSGDKNVQSTIINSNRNTQTCDMNYISNINLKKYKLLLVLRRGTIKTMTFNRENLIDETTNQIITELGDESSTRAICVTEGGRMVLIGGIWPFLLAFDTQKLEDNVLTFETDGHSLIGVCASRNAPRFCGSTTFNFLYEWVYTISGNTKSNFLKKRNKVRSANQDLICTCSLGVFNQDLRENKDIRKGKNQSNRNSKKQPRNKTRGRGRKKYKDSTSDSTDDYSSDFSTNSTVISRKINIRKNSKNTKNTRSNKSNCKTTSKNSSKNSNNKDTSYINTNNFQNDVKHEKTCPIYQNSNNPNNVIIGNWNKRIILIHEDENVHCTRLTYLCNDLLVCVCTDNTVKILSNDQKEISVESVEILCPHPNLPVFFLSGIFQRSSGYFEPTDSFCKFTGNSEENNLDFIRTNKGFLDNIDFNRHDSIDKNAFDNTKCNQEISASNNINTENNPKNNSTDINNPNDMPERYTLFTSPEKYSDLDLTNNSSPINNKFSYKNITSESKNSHPYKIDFQPISLDQSNANLIQQTNTSTVYSLRLYDMFGNCLYEKETERGLTESYFTNDGTKFICGNYAGRLLIFSVNNYTKRYENVPKEQFTRAELALHFNDGDVQQYEDDACVYKLDGNCNIIGSTPLTDNLPKQELPDNQNKFVFSKSIDEHSIEKYSSRDENSSIDKYLQKFSSETFLKSCEEKYFIKKKNFIETTNDENEDFIQNTSDSNNFAQEYYSEVFPIQTCIGIFAKDSQNQPPMPLQLHKNEKYLSTYYPKNFLNTIPSYKIQTDIFEKTTLNQKIQKHSYHFNIEKIAFNHLYPYFLTFQQFKRKYILESHEKNTITTQEVAETNNDFTSETYPITSESNLQLNTDCESTDYLTSDYESTESSSSINTRQFVFTRAAARNLSNYREPTLDTESSSFDEKKKKNVKNTKKRGRKPAAKKGRSRKAVRKNVKKKSASCSDSSESSEVLRAKKINRNTKKNNKSSNNRGRSIISDSDDDY